MDMMFWIWLGVVIVTAIIEFATLDMTSIWFTVGAVPPLIMAAIGGVGWEIQVVVFFCLSALLIIALRGLTKKFLFRNLNEKTNVDSFIGKEFRLLEDTDFENVGSVKINGVVWSAVADNNENLSKGEVVEIVRVDGNKLVVKRAIKKAEAVAKKEPKQPEEKVTEEGK